MKLHLDSNIIEGTPEEIVKYKELLEVSNQADEENEATDEHTFWYIDGNQPYDRNVLKTVSEDYFVDSQGRRYTYSSLDGLIIPITNENTHTHFEGAKHKGKLLRYYPSLDAFIRYNWYGITIGAVYPLLPI